MPSQKPRMMLTLDPETVEAIDTLAKALGKPSATVAAQLLAEMRPQLLDLAKYHRLAKSGHHEAAKRTLRHMLGDAAAELADQRPLRLKDRK